MSGPLPSPSGTPSILAQAQSQLAEALALLPENRHGAVVAVATTDGAKVAFVSRFGEGGGWQFEAYAAKPWDGPLEAGASILHSW